MKVALDITDEIFDDASRAASERGISLDELIGLALQRELHDRKTATPAFRLRDESFRGNGWHPDMRGMDRTRLWEMAYVD